MGIVFRQSVKSSIAIFTGALLGALTIYLSTLFIPKQEFGFRNNLTAQAVVGGQILLFGLHNMLSVYIHKYADDDKRRPALVTISMVLPFFIIAIATVLYILFKNPIIALFQPQDIPFIARYFLWLPVFILLFAYQALLETYLISQLKVAKATFIREVLLKGLNIGLIILFGYGLISFDVLIYGTVLLYLVPIALLLMIALNTEAFRFSMDWSVFSRPEKKDIVHFTWYHSLLSLSITLMGNLDVLMVAALSPDGLSSVPVYSVSVIVISFLLIPYRAMLNSAFPVLAQAFSENDMEKVRNIFVRSSMNIFIASGAMLLLIVPNLHNAVAILPEGYEGITTVVLILSAGRMVDMATGMNDQVLSISKHYKYNFYISIILVLLIVAFNWWLIPLYGVNGAAWGTSIALVIYNFIKFYVVRAKLHMQPFSKGTLSVVLAIGVGLGVGYVLPRIDNPFIDAIYRSAVVVPIYAAILLVLKPSNDLNQYVAAIRRNKRLF